jgi:hypothetical protein
MKKLVLSLILMNVLCSLFSQIKNPLPINKPPKKIPVVYTGVIFWEQPGFRGNSFPQNTVGDVSVPFTVRSISMTSGYSVYCSSVGECVGSAVYTSNINRLGYSEGSCNGNRMIIIATPTTRTLEFTLMQAQSDIHNNDCKRVYGTVNLSLVLDNVDILENTNLLTWERGPFRNISAPNSRASNVENIVRTFRIDPALYNRFRLRVDANLGSAHKSCDLCTDFTWESKYRQPYSLDLLISAILAGGSTACLQRTADGRHQLGVAIGLRTL